MFLIFFCPKKVEKPPQKFAYLRQLEVFFSAAPPAQNSPELYFRFIIFSIQPSLLESLAAAVGGLTKKASKINAYTPPHYWWLSLPFKGARFFFLLCKKMPCCCLLSKLACLLQLDRVEFSLFKKGLQLKLDLSCLEQNQGCMN